MWLRSMTEACERLVAMTLAFADCASIDMPTSAAHEKRANVFNGRFFKFEAPQNGGASSRNAKYERKEHRWWLMGVWASWAKFAGAAPGPSKRELRAD